MSVTIRLADEIDISRGDMICRPKNRPTASQDVDAVMLAIGGRAGADVVRHGSERAEITATFEIADNGPARRWLRTSPEFALKRLLAAGVAMAMELEREALDVGVGVARRRREHP